MASQVEEPQLRLLDVARRHWRRYLPAWLFPVFLLGIHTAERAFDFTMPFVVIAIPFFASFFIAVGAPWQRPHAPYWKVVVLVMVVPFLIWTVAVFVRLAILAAINRPDLV